MCIPVGGPDLDLGDNQTPVTSFAWGQFLGELGSAGLGGQFAAQMLGGAGAGNADWGRPGPSEFMQLNFESGIKSISRAADLDPDMLEAYGYSYSPDYGIESIRGPGEMPVGLPVDAAWARTPEGQLEAQSEFALAPGERLPGTSVTGGPIGQPLFPLFSFLPDNDPEQIFSALPPGSIDDFLATSLAGSAGLLTNPEFNGMLDSYADERMAGIVSGSSSQEQPGVAPPVHTAPEGPSANPGQTYYNPQDELSKQNEMNPSPLSTPTDPTPASPPPAAQPGQPSFLSTLQSLYGDHQVAPAEMPEGLLFAELNWMYAGPASGSNSSIEVPSYGPGDIVEGPAGAGATAGSGEPVQGESTSSWTDSQGFFTDGRLVPNFFKHVNKELWGSWGKYSGADAVLTFPFVLAASGAIFLPQAINDIPNIPSLFARAYSEADQANWGRAFEAAGDALGALGILGELSAGAEALSVESNVSNARGPGGPRTTRYNASDPSPPAWPVKNLRYNDPRIVTQSAPTSCNAAATEMAAQAAGVDGVVNESSILREIRETTGNPRIALGRGGIDNAEIVEAANALEHNASIMDGQSWMTDARQLDNLEDEINRIGTNGPWVAEMKYNGAHHSVTVVGMDAVGDVMVLDPAGYAYEMTLADFEAAWYDQFISRR